jgi:uncharacterized protein
MDVVVWFFLLGVLAKLLKSDLRLPEPLYETLSIYLLLAIGLKGGIELSRQSLWELFPQIALCVGLGLLIPVLVMPVLKALGLRAVDAAAMAAHYGSVSVVTFAVGLAYLNAQGIATSSHAPLWVAVMEAPGIMAGIVLAYWFARDTRTQAGSNGLSAGATSGAAAHATTPAVGGLRGVIHDVLFGKSILLLMGGLFVGAVMGEQGVAPIAPLFITPFKGVLALFLLELGLVAGARLGDLRRYGVRLIAFGVLAPPVLALLGMAGARALGLGVGDMVIFAVLAASASYIAAPTAMRMALPKANAALSITASLGLTFPFNIVLGVPLYTHMAVWWGSA